MNGSGKGARAERRARHLLEGRGYTVVRSAASKGPVDLVAWNGDGLKLVQVKSGQARPSAAERAAFLLVCIPANATREFWVFRDRCVVPTIEWIE